MSLRILIRIFSFLLCRNLYSWKTDIFRRWAFFSVLNLLILSLVGIILRYKIILPLPFVNQKNLLHAHSHFAFSGWVSMALFTAIVWVLSKHATLDLKKYERLFLLGQFASFGMLFTFPFFGYKLPSIFFSTVSVIFSYLFVYSAWKDMGKSVSAFTCCKLVQSCICIPGDFFLWHFFTGLPDVFG